VYGGLISRLLGQENILSISYRLLIGTAWWGAFFMNSESGS